MQFLLHAKRSSNSVMFSAAEQEKSFFLHSTAHEKESVYEFMFYYFVISRVHSSWYQHPVVSTESRFRVYARRRIGEEGKLWHSTDTEKGKKKLLKTARWKKKTKKSRKPAMINAINTHSLWKKRTKKYSCSYKDLRELYNINRTKLVIKM